MKRFQRMMAAALLLALLIGLLPAQALAVPEDGAGALRPTELVTGSGEVVPIDDSWAAKYPYGGFAFNTGELSLAEGGEAVEIPIYRMGGDAGRATLYLLFCPLSTPLDADGTIMGSGNAAGFDDLVIEAEDALPIARYQAPGKDPDPEPGDARITRSAYTGADAEAGDLLLQLDTAAEAWQWYAESCGAWQKIEDGTEDHLIVGKDDPDEYDFRCVYTLSGVTYCTASLGGAAYEKPEPEVLEPMPDDLDLAPEQSFTRILPLGDDPASQSVFALTFADGEWVKYLRIRATEDSLAEALEFATFTMLATDGGDIVQQAGTLILSVTDNDPAEPFTLGFALAQTQADKAEGTAKVAVVRTGGGQTPVTVSYATADGSALAGRDYEAVSGELLFYADYDTQIIEIPLIDDGIADDMPRSFTLSLGEIKGDSEGLGTLARTEMTVSLTNSGTAEGRNLATMLAVGAARDPRDLETMLSAEALTPQGEGEAYRVGLDGAAAPLSRSPDVAEDASARAVVFGGPLQAAAGGGTVTGTQKTLADEELLRGDFSLGAPQGQGFQTYQYGTISFSGSHSGAYWSDYATVAGGSPNDYSSWSGGEADGSAWLLKNDDTCYATLSVPHMGQYFDQFHGWATFKIARADSWTEAFCGTEFVFGKVCVLPGYEFSCVKSVSGKNVKYFTKHSFTVDLDISNPLYRLQLQLRKWDAHAAASDAYVRLYDGTLRRRYFQNDLRLAIHTANDGAEGNGNVKTAPAGGAALDPTTNVYNNMKPSVSVEPGAGGVNDNGRLYVGSQIRVSLSNSPSYYPYGTEMFGSTASMMPGLFKLGAAVYLTDKNGNIVNAESRRTESGDYLLTLYWNGITKEDLDSGVFTINVVMSRKQDFTLNLSPSVERETDEAGNPKAEIKTSAVPDALDLFWRSGGDSITVGYSEYTPIAPYFSSDAISEITLHRADLGDTASAAIKSLGTLENVQYINFNRSENDYIVYRGRSFRGNERIWLDMADLAGATASFLYYNEAYLNATSIMDAAVDSVGIYWDGNCNGKIDGTYNAQSGYFELDRRSGDTLFYFMDRDASECETFFQPTTDEKGTHQFIAQVLYTLTPRSFFAPPGKEDDTMQVLPALTTTVTDAANYGALTEAEQSYRYLRSGQRSDGSYTSDGHLMYGPVASAPQYVDVPLGGDYAPAHAEGDGMVWTPDHRGALLIPFENPEPIFVAHSMLGDNKALTDFSYDERSGEIVLDAAAKKELNGYLGAFVGNSTIALCTMEQQYTTAELPSHADSLQPESSTLIERSVYADVGNAYAVGTDPADQQNADSGVPDDSKFPEFNNNVDLHNSGFRFRIPTVLDWVTFIYNGDSIQILISIPIITWTKGKGANWTNIQSLQKAKDQFNAVNQAMQSHDTQGLMSAITGGNGIDGGSLKSSDFAISLNFTAILILKYNTIDNTYIFDRFSFGVLGALAFKAQKRLEVCPIAYLYFKFTVTAALMGSFEYDETKKYREHPVASPDAPIVLKKGEIFELVSPYVYADIAFKGKIYIEECVSRDDATPVKNGNKGYIKSDGKLQTIKLAEVHGVEFSDPIYVRIIAQEDTTISVLELIKKFDRKAVFTGMDVQVRPIFEGGVGAGIELVKVEAFARATFDIIMRFAPYNKETKTYGNFDFKKFQFIIGLGFRLTALAFNFEFDAIEYVVTYDGDKDKWDGRFRSSFAPNYTLTAEDGLQAPQSSLGTQEVRSPNLILAAAAQESGGAESNELPAGFASKLKAYNTDAPFQVSGYGSAVSAFTLADGLNSGYGFRVVPAKGENYVLYTISRADAASALDHSMLVMSRLIATGATPGLVNPIDPADPTPYIVVDDDAGGDLEYEAAADESGAIRVAWISYGAAAQGLQSGLSAGALFQQATRSRVVKTAVFDPAAPGTGFSPSQTVSDAPQGDLVFLPLASADAVAYVEADPMDAEARAQAIENYKAALRAAGYDPDSDDEAERTLGQYRLQTQTALWDLSGGVNRLSVAEVGAQERSIQSELAPGQVIDNLEFAKIGGKYYLAFTTSERCFTDAQGDETDDPDAIANMVTIRRLCLKALDPQGETLSFGKTYVLRTVYDFDDNSLLPDGVYTGGSADEAESPGFANLRFLNAKLGSTLGRQGANDSDNFLLFEMSGCTYIIREADLIALAEGREGTITPFFTGSGEAGAMGEVPARTGVTIGADGDGGLAAVYIAPVAHTSNNAVFISRYDSATGAWGEGTMLAMNHMDVYERSVREQWDEETTAAAYLDPAQGGGMDQFVFADLQIALGTKASAAPQGEEAESTPEGASAADATLLILAQGNRDTLVRVETENAVHYLPAPGASANRAGVYAISYGTGQQALGEGSLSFFNPDFTAGAPLHVTASFSNTGDVGIRGSAGQPITVRLIAEDRPETKTVSMAEWTALTGAQGALLQGEDPQDNELEVLASDREAIHSTTLAEWTVTQNIRPGQAVSLSADFTLPVSLPEGTVLNLAVSEDKSYAGEPYAAVLRGLTTVENKPELGFENGVSLLPSQSTTSGSAVYDVDFTVSNRGSADGRDVYVQFSYNSGEKDVNGHPVFKALDISRNTLAVGEETKLALNAASSDFAHGVLALGGIRQGYGRQVKGTLTIPGKYFETLRSSTAELRVEIFSAADSDLQTASDGFITVTHGEYNTANNVCEESVSHATIFNVPDRISLPLGMTLRLPVHYTASDAAPSHILAAEFPHTQEENSALQMSGGARFKRMNQRMSELYYEQSAFTNGSGFGSVVITPMEEGSSYVRITDLNTNDFVDVACLVTPGADGMNIMSGPTGAGIFRFLNADGTVWSQNGDPAKQGWSFTSGVTKWGADGSAPYLEDLAKAKPGASFRYESESESIKLVFNGTVRVESTFPNFQPVTLTSKGGSGTAAGQAASVVFGNNAPSMPHTITITVLSPAEGEAYAEFDRLIEYYHGASPFTFSDSSGASFYWSASFPEAGTCRAAVERTLHIVDSRALTDVWAEGDNVSAGTPTKESDGHWLLPLTFSDNGPVVIHAHDRAGNHAILHLDVDWFTYSFAVGEPDFAVTTASWASAGLRLMAPGPENAEATRHLVVTTGENAPADLKLSVSFLGDDPNGAVSATEIPAAVNASNCFRAAADGLYLVRAETTLSEGADPQYAYRICRNDGSVEEGNAASVRRWSAQLIRVEDESTAPAPEPTPDVPSVPAPERDKKTVGTDGTVVETAADGAGATVTLSAKALEAALERGEPAPIPAPLPAGSGEIASLPVIRVELPADCSDRPAGQLPRIAIPLSGASDGALAFLRQPDGSWAPVKDCYVSGGILVVPVEKSCELVIGRNDKTFPDVKPDAWYAPYVAFVTARGIFNGTGSGFEPEGTMTRAMIAQVLYNLDRHATPGIRAEFRDVAPDAWYADAVGWAAKAGIILGYDGAFSPDVPVSRQDLVTILYRYARASGYPIAAGADLGAFSDADDVASYAREAMAWAVAIGAVSGMGDGTLAPGGTATRAQVAKILQVFIECVR